MTLHPGENCCLVKNEDRRDRAPARQTGERDREGAQRRPTEKCGGDAQKQWGQCVGPAAKLLKLGPYLSIHRKANWWWTEEPTIEWGTLKR